jgi:polar amino acid transport system substrate-binding protein
MLKDRIKLLIALMLAAMLVFVACGEAGDDEPSDAGSGSASTPAEEEPATELDLAVEGRLTIGSDIPYPPFEFEKGGELTGFDVEIVQDIAERLGLENEADDWISTDFGTIFQQLQSGARFDVVVAAVTGYAPEGTPSAETVAERVALIDFTDPYYPSLQSLMVDTADSDVKSVDELPEGARVGVQSGTTGAAYAKQNLTGAEIVEFEKAPEMYNQLQAGQLDAVFNDLPVSLDATKNSPDLQVVEQVDTGEQYAIAVNKENTALKDAINGALSEMFEDGTYAEIFKKYFPKQELPSYASE